MKLATLKDGSRDGQLAVVSRDLKQAHFATDIAGKLQTVLDDWNFYAPQLQDLYDALNAGRARHPFAFNPRDCMAPLPRAYQWADGSAYVNHVELVRKARGAEMPPEFWTDPLMYQGGSDDFLGPQDDIVCASEAFGIDFEAEVAVITGDVKMGATPEQAGEAIRLLTLVNDISLRNLIPAEKQAAKGGDKLQAANKAKANPYFQDAVDEWQKSKDSFGALPVPDDQKERYLAFAKIGTAESLFHLADRDFDKFKAIGFPVFKAKVSAKGGDEKRKEMQAKFNTWMQGDFVKWMGEKAKALEIPRTK